MNQNTNEIFRAHSGAVGTVAATLSSLIGGGTSGIALNAGALIKAHLANAGTIVIGHSLNVTVDEFDEGNEDGFPLAAGENLNVTATNTDLIFLLASEPDQKFNVITT